MLELYAANTPNGQRTVVVLEELAVPYRLHKVDVFKGGAKTADMLKLNPNARVPILVDPQGPSGERLVLTQSWVICLYLAEKLGRFLPQDPVGRLRVTELMFQLGTDVMMVHSTLNAVTNFVPEKVESTIAFYSTRLEEALRALDRRLAEADYLAGALSVADFAFYPVYRYRLPFLERLDGFDNLRRWGRAMDAREAPRRALTALA